ncbi:MAG: response regulator transcription factor [Chromatiales bacterium]|nr:response regulator transcription factor [Chromatiales bacterium]
MNILIVEDNKTLAGNIIDCLELKGHEVDYAASGKQCLSLLETTSFDVIVLDVMMPGMNGYETCRTLRYQHRCQTPVIFLTAKTELEHKLAGFDAGGDDYLTKPFEIEELLCRIEVLALRGKRQDVGLLQYGSFSLDTANGDLSINDHKIRLNNVQYKIMRELIQKAPDTVSRQRLEEYIWGDELPQSDTLKTHIYQLRKLISTVLPDSGIETMHSRGYRIRS